MKSTPVKLLAALVTAVLVVVACQQTPAEPLEPQSTNIRYSTSSDRSDPGALDGATLSGTVHLFLQNTDAENVVWKVNGRWLANRGNSPFQVTLDTATLGPGQHTLNVDRYRGGRMVGNWWARFTVGQSSPGGPRIDAFRLVDTSNGQVIRTLEDGQTLDLSGLPDTLNVRVDTAGPVGSVRSVSSVDGNEFRNTINNLAPYSATGKNDRNQLTPFTFRAGRYIFTSTAYSQAGGAGSAGESRTLTLTVVTEGESPTPPTSSGSVGPRPPPSPRTPTIRVDCQGGGDHRTLQQLSNRTLRPGDVVGLRRGCTFDGKLTLRNEGTSSNPILITAYGSGDLPVIRGGMDHAVEMRGRYTILELVRIEQNANGLRDSGGVCRGQPVGWRVGVFIPNSHNTVRFIEATGGTAGVHVSRGGTHATVQDSRLYNNTIMSRNTVGGDDDSGAWGLLVNGDHVRASHNLTSGNTACSFDYRREGAAFEIYNGNAGVYLNNLVRDHSFTELGRTSVGNRFERNVFVPDGESGTFAVAHGSGTFGGVGPTTFIRNTVYAPQGRGVIVWGETARTLEMRDNVIQAERPLYITTDNSKVTGNIIYGRNNGLNGGFVMRDNRNVDPQFIDPPSNLRVRSGSPAAGKGAY